MTKKMIKNSLHRLQTNYFEAAVKNIEASADIGLEIPRQLSSSTTFFLIFIATTFFFLEDKLNINVVGVPLKVWLSCAIAFGAISIMLGILNLSGGKRFLIESGKKYFKQSQKIADYIEKTGLDEVDNIPEDLKIKDNEINSNRKIDIFLTLQIIFFIVTIVATVIPLIILIVK